MGPRGPGLQPWGPAEGGASRGSPARALRAGRQPPPRLCVTCFSRLNPEGTESSVTAADVVSLPHSTRVSSQRHPFPWARGPSVPGGVWRSGLFPPKGQGWSRREPLLQGETLRWLREGCRGAGDVRGALLPPCDGRRRPCTRPGTEHRGRPGHRMATSQGAGAGLVEAVIQVERDEDPEGGSPSRLCAPRTSADTATHVAPASFPLRCRDT